MRGIGQSYSGHIDILALPIKRFKYAHNAIISFFTNERPDMSVILSSGIDSPCVRNCCLNDDDICVGCGRSLQEITRWSAATDADKQLTLISAAERKRLIRLRQQS